MIPRILVFPGSLRSGAFSASTADAATRELVSQGAEITRLSLGDYALPLVDQNLEREKGVPANAMLLARQIGAHDGVLIASPEYNASIPPLLKNAIDWISRVREPGVTGFAGKAVGLCSSSDGSLGGVRGLYHLRAVLMNCRAEIVTPQCSVARASEAFDEDGNLRDERMRRSMSTLCEALMERARQLSTRIEP